VPPAVLALVDHGEDVAEGVELAIEADLLVEHREAIARLEVAVEVDVPGEDARHLVGERLRSAGLLDRGLERAVDDAGDGADPFRALEGLPGGLPLVARAGHLDA